MQTDINKPLGKLEGSGLQIEWATKVREEAIRSLRNSLKRSLIHRLGVHKLDPDELPERIKGAIPNAGNKNVVETALRKQIIECQDMVILLDRLGSETSAKWFLENRNSLNARAFGKELKCGFGGLFLQGLLNQKSA